MIPFLIYCLHSGETEWITLNETFAMPIAAYEICTWDLLFLFETATFLLHAVLALMVCNRFQWLANIKQGEVASA